MATLETSLEANSDRQTDRQTDRMTEKATYRGSSYRSAQKVEHAGYFPLGIAVSLGLSVVESQAP